jgi:lysophospholipase L1-like esterase
MNRIAVSVLMSLVVALLAGCATVGRGTSEGSGWVGTWAAAPYAQANPKGAFAEDTTLRQIVHVSVGGSVIRLVLTNEFGKADLKIGGVTVARPTPSVKVREATPFDSGMRPDGRIQPGSAIAVRFGGRLDITIAPGAVAVSDPVAVQLSALSDLAVTLFIPGQTIETISLHAFADQTNFVAAGNQLNGLELESAHMTSSWQFLKGIDVRGKAQGAIVCFGDSITDGAPSSLNANHRYPDILAARLQANEATAKLGVLNVGIGGNSVLHDTTFTGPNALARFDRDVIAQAGVRYVILLEGINDIGRVPAPQQPSDVITADDLIGAYKQMIVRAHTHGIKIIGATLTPYQGAHTDSDIGQEIRDKVNDFIRDGGMFDDVVDFAKVTADPDNPKRFATAVGSPDHLHPGDAGYRMMGESIDLALFSP